MRCACQELKPFGTKVLIVEPGAFRTDFLARSMTLAEARMSIYEETAARMRGFSVEMSGRQGGDPAKGAQVIPAAVEAEGAALRLPLGPDAPRNIQAKLASVAADLTA